MLEMTKPTCLGLPQPLVSSMAAISSKYSGPRSAVCRFRAVRVLAPSGPRVTGWLRDCFGSRDHFQKAPQQRLSWGPIVRSLRW